MFLQSTAEMSLGKVVVSSHHQLQALRSSFHHYLLVFHSPAMLSWALTAPTPQDIMSPSLDASPCPQNWVKNGSRCYYISDTEENWNTSQILCSSLGGSLVVMGTPEEKVRQPVMYCHVNLLLHKFRERGCPLKALGLGRAELVQKQRTVFPSGREQKSCLPSGVVHPVSSPI